MSLILKAARDAEAWHHGQVRKFTGRPYIEHPARVAARITRHAKATESRVAAAWLHDVMEDCGRAKSEIDSLFGVRVGALVSELTNPSKAFPTLPRADRKKADRIHASKCSEGARLIKLADRADNLREVEPGSEFARMYAAESRLLLHPLIGTDEELESELADAIRYANAATDPHRAGKDV